MCGTESSLADGQTPEGAVLYVRLRVNSHSASLREMRLWLQKMPGGKSAFIELGCGGAVVRSEGDHWSLVGSIRG